MGLPLELRAIRDALRTLDEGMRQDKCPRCGKALAGMIPAGMRASQVGLCTCDRPDIQAQPFQSWDD